MRTGDPGDLTVLAVFVFDSASLSLLERLLDEGRLPTLAELRRRGIWHTLAPRRFDPGHTTLYTGKEVGEHGLYYVFQWVAAEQRVRYLHDLPLTETVWERLARLERRALVIDAYEGWPPATLRGVAVSGWQFHERLVLPGSSWPPSAARALGRLYGPPPRLVDVYGRPSLKRLRELRPGLLAAGGRAADAAVHFVAREPFDLVWVHFSAVHLAGHHFWDLSLLPEAEARAARGTPMETTLEDVYRDADQAMGRVLEALPAGTDVIVVSSSGMGSNTSRSDLLPEMLTRIVGSAVPGRESRAAGAWLWRLRAAVSTDLRARVSEKLPDGVVRELTTRLYLRGVKWRRTPAFAAPGDYRSFVRLNIRGRERDGIVPPTEADALLDEIVEGLTTFREPNGAPAVAAAERITARTAEGPGTAALPDLVVDWPATPAASLTGVTSPRFGDVVRRGLGSGRPGNHTDDAWVLVMQDRSRAQDGGAPPQLADVAATACAVAGVETDGLAGTPLLVPR